MVRHCLVILELLCLSFIYLLEINVQYDSQQPKLKCFPWVEKFLANVPQEGSVRQILAVLGQFLESVPEGTASLQHHDLLHCELMCLCGEYGAKPQATDRLDPLCDQVQSHSSPTSPFWLKMAPKYSTNPVVPCLRMVAIIIGTNSEPDKWHCFRGLNSYQRKTSENL